MLFTISIFRLLAGICSPNCAQMEANRAQVSDCNFLVLTSSRVAESVSAKQCAKGAPQRVTQNEVQERSYAGVRCAFAATLDACKTHHVWHQNVSPTPKTCRQQCTAAVVLPTQMWSASVLKHATTQHRASSCNTGSALKVSKAILLSSARTLFNENLQKPQAVQEPAQCLGTLGATGRATNSSCRVSNDGWREPTAYRKKKRKPLVHKKKTP